MKKIVPNKTFLAVFAFGVASSMTRVSHADVDYFGAYGDAKTQTSPQTMAVELRVGRYLPNVDDEFGGGATPFEDHFGRKQRWMVGMELDWQLLQMEGIGSLGPGVGFGYTALTSRDFHDAPGSSNREEAAEGSSLKILPLYAVAVLRIDALAQRTPVPLAFYGKGGLSYAYWWATYSQGLDRVEGTKASDTSWGTTWALGVSLLLDALDRRAANNMDATNGINNSYVFLEWYNSDLSGFGSNKMQVGDSTWMAGLAFEL
jgi:hypothetical protein